jgi:mannosyltransferase
MALRACLTGELRSTWICLAQERIRDCMATLEKLRLNKERVSLLAILLLALALRLVNLGSRNLWYDEAFAVLYAEKPLAAMLHGTVTQVGGAAADVHPLFFYSILHAWMRAVGQSPVAVRALSALLGVATVAMAYLLARRLFDRQAGLATAAIVAIAPFHVYYSQEARMYALLGFAAVAMTYFFVRAWAGGGWGHWVVFGICGAMTLYAHNLGFTFVAGLDLWVLWAWLRPGAPRWRNLRPVLLSHLLIVGLFAPWLTVMPSQFGKIQQAYWVEQPGLAKLIQTILIFHFAYDNQSLPRWLLPPALFFSLLVLAVVAFEFARRRTASGPRLSFPAPYSLLLSLTLTPILLTFLVSQIRPVYIVRALLPSALTYYTLVVGVLVAGVVPKPVKWGLLLPSTAIVAISLVHHYSYAQFPRPPFDEAVAYLRENRQSGDAIVHDNKLTFFPCHYYDRGLPQAFMADPPGAGSDTLALPTQEALGLPASRTMEEATVGSQRVWFVIFQRALAEYQELGHPQPPHRTWLEDHYRLIETVIFNDLDIYLYETP